MGVNWYPTPTYYPRVYIYNTVFTFACKISSSHNCDRGTSRVLHYDGATRWYDDRTNSNHLALLFAGRRWNLNSISNFEIVLISHRNRCCTPFQNSRGCRWYNCQYNKAQCGSQKLAKFFEYLKTELDINHLSSKCVHTQFDLPPRPWAALLVNPLTQVTPRATKAYKGFEYIILLLTGRLLK